MKKFAVLFLVLAMLVSMNLTAFADGGFVESPSNNQAPVVEDVVVEGVPEDVEVEVSVTPYNQTSELDAPAAEEMKTAYDEIKATSDLTVLSDKLTDVAKDKGVKVDNLAISDLFDISINVEEHGEVKLKLKSEQLENFVALLHRHNDAWEVVEDARIENGSLVFSVDDFSPFAIVVDAPAAAAPDYSIYLWAAIAIVALVVVAVVWKKSKKVAAK